MIDLIDWIRGPTVNVGRVYEKGSLHIESHSKIRGWKNYRKWLIELEKEMSAQGFDKNEWFKSHDLDSPKIVERKPE